MVGESGTSKTGKVHRYYICTNRKRKHNCKKAIDKKDWVEEAVVQYVVQEVLTDKNIVFYCLFYSCKQNRGFSLKIKPIK